MEYWVVVLGLTFNGDWGLNILDGSHATEAACTQYVEKVLSGDREELGNLRYSNTLTIRCIRKGQTKEGDNEQHKRNYSRDANIAAVQR